MQRIFWSNRRTRETELKPLFSMDRLICPCVTARGSSSSLLKASKRIFPKCLVSRMTLWPKCCLDTCLIAAAIFKRLESTTINSSPNLTFSGLRKKCLMNAKMRQQSPKRSSTPNRLKIMPLIN